MVRRKSDKGAMKRDRVTRIGHNRNGDKAGVADAATRAVDGLRKARLVDLGQHLQLDSDGGSDANGSDSMRKIATKVATPYRPVPPIATGEMSRLGKQTVGAGVSEWS
jgi:hypothetical protein